MGDKIPGIKSLGEVPALNSLRQETSGKKGSFIKDEYLYSSASNFYFTCAVTKASTTMAKCVELFTKDIDGALHPTESGK
jgi:hypothetical protein